MTWAPEDVTDADVARCESQHLHPQLDCPYCRTRADLRICARCEQEIWPHETCQQCPSDEPALVVDGFGTALATVPHGGGDRG